MSENQTNSNKMECCICYDKVKEPMVTPCGHLFCYDCIEQWLEDGHNQCPICKSYVSTEKLIPLYINADNDKDPRTLHHRRPPQNSTQNSQRIPNQQENETQFNQQPQQPGFFNRIINRINRDFENLGLAFSLQGNATDAGRRQQQISQALIIIPIVFLALIIINSIYS